MDGYAKIDVKLSYFIKKAVQKVYVVIFKEV